MTKTITESRLEVIFAHLYEQMEKRASHAASPIPLRKGKDAWLDKLNTHDIMIDVALDKAYSLFVIKHHIENNEDE